MPWVQAIGYLAENVSASTLKAMVAANSVEFEGYRIATGRGVDPKTSPVINVR